MENEIKEIVNASNIKLLKVDTEAVFPKTPYNLKTISGRVKNKFFTDVASQIMPLCEGEEFLSAETRENTLRFKGEIILCSQPELMHVLEKVYKAGQIQSLLKVTKPFDDES